MLLQVQMQLGQQRRCAGPERTVVVVRQVHVPMSARQQVRREGEAAQVGDAGPVGGEFPIMLPRRLNESTFAVMQPDPNRLPRQVSLRDGGPEWRSIGRLREVRTARHWHRTQVRPRSASDTAHDSGAASDTYV